MPRKPWIPREDEAQLFNEVYMDETSQNGHRFFVLGGIMIPLVYSDLFESTIIEARSSRLKRVRSNGLITEIGWKYVGNGDYDEYKDIVDAYFGFSGKMSGAFNDSKFHCHVLDTQVRGRRYSRGLIGEDNFNREIFFLSGRIAREYINDCFTSIPRSAPPFGPRATLANFET